MSAAGDVARMLTLVPWLLERPGASVAEAAAAFGVSERQVHRDLYHLDFCGLPGLGGGDLFDVSIVGDRVVVTMAEELRQPLRLTPREALLLVLTGEAVAAALPEDLPALRTALDKVRHAMGVPPGVSVEPEDEGAAWTAALRDAIGRRRRVRLAYQGRGDDAPVTRRVDPWRLHVAGGVWYVQGHDDRAGDLRTFRLDRIAALDVTDEPWTAAPPAEPLPEPHYEPGADDIEVVVDLAASARWVAEAVEPESVEERPDGGRRLRFHTDAPRWVRRLLLVAGAGAQVVAPTELARTVREDAAAALARYGA